MYTTTVSANGSAIDAKAHLSQEVVQQRLRTQESAQHLSLSAIRQWEKAISGLVALPAAAALSTAAVTLLAASLVERAFEIFDMTVSDVGRRVGHEYDARGERRPEVRAAEKDTRS